MRSCEADKGVQRHIGENSYLEAWVCPLPVISSGGTMLRETIAQNRYSFEESRNLSCGREYRAFQLAQLRRSTRLFESDPSPGLWPSPFGLKGRRFNGQAKRLIYAKLECPMQDIHLQGGTCLPVSSIGGGVSTRMQALGEGPHQRRRMDVAKPMILSDV